MTRYELCVEAHMILSLKRPSSDGGHFFILGGNFIRTTPVNSRKFSARNEKHSNLISMAIFTCDEKLVTVGLHGPLAK